MLKLINIQVDYNETTVLSNLDFEITEGTIHMLLGPHGSGKSTLTELICGIARPAMGQYLFNDRIYKKLSYREARNIGIELIPQKSDLLVPLTIYENFFMLSEIKTICSKMSKEKVTTFLEESGFVFDLDQKGR